MDGLTQEERALAWSAGWDPSFDGVAIVNKDFTFRSVNPQFCEILKITPGDLIGKRFQDITPPHIRALDEHNAQLVIDGKIPSYFLPKTYEFENSRRVHILLLAKGVFLKKHPDDPENATNFQFFVSKIMLNESVPSHLTLELSNQKQIGFLDFIVKYYKLLVSLGIVLGTLVYTIFDLLVKAK